MLNLQAAEYLATEPGTQIYLENWTASEVSAAQPGFLLVHGGPGLYGYLGDFARSLGRNAPTWTYFQRGGAWSKSTGPMTVAAHILDLQKVLKRLSVEVRDLTVVGHSWGALLAMLALKEDSSLAKRVRLVGPMPFDFEGVKLFLANIDWRLTAEERRVRSERMSGFATLTTPEARNELFNSLSDDIFKTYHFHPTFDRLSSKMDGTDADSFFASQGDLGRMMLESDLIQSLSGFTLPVEMIYGEYDPSPCLRLAAQLKAVLPYFSAQGLSECGHYPWWENDTVQKKFLALIENK